jgi:hypothetical protein
MKLNNKDEMYLRGYAQALQDLMFRINGDNSCGKSYDPIDFSENEIHSYAFDLKDGGRHHPLSDYESVQEITDLMLGEATEWIKGDMN